MKGVIPYDDITKPLLKQIDRMASATGRWNSDILEAMLDYILWNFDPMGKPPARHWEWSKEETAMLHEMMLTYFRQMEYALARKQWYDMFGDLFMAWMGDKKYRGQCFTPADVCDMMAECTLGDRILDEPTASIRAFGKRITVCDCACGSGRTLLAGAAYFLKKHAKKPYLIAEDISSMCCKMSAVNFMVHGCFGEVVCHDTLIEPDEVRVGYVVNEGIYPFPGIPTVRVECNPDKLVATSLWRMRKRKEEEPQPKRQEAVQLSLF